MIQRFSFHHLTPALLGPEGAGAPIGSSADFSPGTVAGVFTAVSSVTTSLLAQAVRKNSIANIVAIANCKGFCGHKYNFMSGCYSRLRLAPVRHRIAAGRCLK
jgi:hypothetical protein